MQSIPGVRETASIIDAELVRITTPNNDGTTSTLTFSSSYRSESVSGIGTFTPLGGLMFVSGVQRDLALTNFDLAITITGVDGQNIFAFMQDIKGSKVEVWRAFYDANYIRTSHVLRFTGIITSYNITEEIDFTMVDDAHSITFMCENQKSVLETKYSGRYTNPSSWKRWAGNNDISMDRVPAIELTTYDFGKTSSNSGAGVTVRPSFNTSITSVKG